MMQAGFGFIAVNFSGESITNATNYGMQIGFEFITTSKLAFELTLIGIAAFIAFGLYAALKIRMRQPTTGTEELIGKTTTVLEDIDPVGTVKIHGEIWQAKSDTGDIAKGEDVRIIRKEGLTLIVEKLDGGK